MTQVTKHRPLAEDVPDDALLKIKAPHCLSAASARSRASR